MSHGKILLLVEKWYIMVPRKLLHHHSPVVGICLVSLIAVITTTFLPYTRCNRQRQRHNQRSRKPTSLWFMYFLKKNSPGVTTAVAAISTVAWWLIRWCCFLYCEVLWRNLWYHYNSSCNNHSRCMLVGSMGSGTSLFSSLLTRWH